MQLKLIHKGLILVAVPLFFEIVFVIALSLLLNQAEQETQRESQAKLIVAEVTGVGKSIYDAVGALVAHASLKSEQTDNYFQNSIHQARNKLSEIKKIAATTAHETQSIDRIFLLGNEALDLFAKAKENVDVSDFSSQELRSDTKDIINKLTTTFDEVVAEETKIATSESGKQARLLVRRFIYAGVAVNILLALGMVIFYVKGITEPLVILTDNSMRLAEGKSLNSPNKGHDEIAYVDRVFHAMAHTLAESARKERAIVDNAVDVICSLDENNRFVKANPAATKVLGFNLDKLIGQSLLDLITENTTEQTLTNITKAKQGGDSVTFENALSREDGSEVQLLWSIHWSQADKALFCVVHDISERKELEQLKQQFVAMVSHDLRTPLTSVSSFLSVLSSGAMTGCSLSEKAKKSLEAAERSLNSLIRLVNDLLDVERLESGGMQMEFREINLDVVVERAVESVEKFAESQRVFIEAAATGIKIFGDAERLVQVLINLLSNAIKYSPQDGVVTVNIEAIPGYVEIAVLDHGRGIPLAFRQIIFERFKQVELSDSTKRGGTGLGLAICKAIVEQHDGIIGVDSKEGQYTRFWFRLPMRNSINWKNDDQGKNSSEMEIMRPSPRRTA